MDKVTLSPDEDGYSFSDGKENVRAVVDGGMGIYNIGILNAAIVLNVQWTCDPDEYDYLQGVYAQHVLEGHAPFPIDLFIDSLRFVEHQVIIVPGTFGLKSQSGLQFVVGCSLMVRPAPAASFTGPLEKMAIPVTRDGYAFNYTAEAVLTELDGGLPRMYRDQLGVSNLVNVQWTVGPAGFIYLREFYRHWVVDPQPFPIDLVLELATATEKNAQFVPGSMRVGSIKGHTVVVNAQLEVLPVTGCECGDQESVAWQINFETGEAEDQGGYASLPMQIGTGFFAAADVELAIIEDDPLYGTRSLLLGGSSGDAMWFQDPAVAIYNSWTIRWSMTLPAGIVTGEDEVTVIEIYDWEDTNSLILSLRPYEGGEYQFHLHHVGTDEQFLSGHFSPVEGFVYDFELSYQHTDEDEYHVRFYEGGASILLAGEHVVVGMQPYGIQTIDMLYDTSNEVDIRLDEIRVVNYVEHTGPYTHDVPFCYCPPPAEPSAGPWLYYPTEAWPGSGGDDSEAPIHKRTYEYAPITGAPEPFALGVGVTDNVGLGDNEHSVSDLWIALYYAGTGGGDDGSLPTIPIEGEQYTWEPADPESSVVPVFSLDDPSGGVWMGGTQPPTHFLTLTGGSTAEWAGGVLTLFNSDIPGTFTIITFLPSSFIYPPVSVYYGPLA